MENKKIKKNSPVLSIVYVYYNTPGEISESIKSLRTTIKNIPYEIIIVDNNSNVPFPASTLSLKSVRYIKNKKNYGYGRALNIAFAKAKGEYILCTNTDTIYKKNAVKLLFDKVESDKKIGVIGPKMTDSNGAPLNTASKLPLFPVNLVLYTFFRYIPPFSKIERSYHFRNKKVQEREVDAIGGACMLFRRKVFEHVGGFDKRFFLYFEEADICKRIKDSGYKVTYYPKAVITHFVGRSLSDKERIRRYFEKSRFRFVEKHQSKFLAFFSESIIRFLHPTTIVLMGIVGLSLFINLYKITTLMMFFGDFGRDMLAAREMILAGTIPLVGIPSSVVWLSQGPLSIYLIGFSFIIGGFEPFIPAVFYAILGSVTCLLVYKLGAQLFNKYVGILGALFFASSPLVIINTRIPYHHAPIPFFSAIFFISLFTFLKNGSTLSLIASGFFLGLLFLLELSNGVLFFLLALLFYVYKIKLTRKTLGTLIASFSVGIFPFILYDLTHMFTQTVGFVAWVLNRIRLFLGLTISGNSTTSHAPDAFNITWDNLVRFVFPMSEEIATILIAASGLYLLTRFISKKMRHGNEVFLVICLFVPFLGFIIHARPGMAYFPLIFPLLAVMVGDFFYVLKRRIKMTIFYFFVLVISNVSFVLANSYFLNVGGQKGSEINDWNYGLGVSLVEQMEIVSYLKAESEKTPIRILPGGFLADFKTSIDNYHFLALSMGIIESKDGRMFTIYQDISEIPPTQNVVFHTQQVYVVIDE